MLCEGMTEEDLDSSMETKIALHGFTLIHVAADPSWTYSIGLADEPGVADLVCIGIEQSAQWELVDILASAVAGGEKISDSMQEVLDLRLVDVHPYHLGGDRFAAWSRRRGRAPRRGQMQQLVLGPSWFCECHANRGPRLDRPVPLGRTGPNRAERRRRRRTHRRP